MTTTTDNDTDKAPEGKGGVSILFTDMRSYAGQASGAGMRRAGTAAPNADDGFRPLEKAVSGIIRYGADNLYPEYILELADMSVPLSTALTMNAWAVAGSSIDFVAPGGEMKTDERAADAWAKAVAGSEDELVHCNSYDLVSLGWCAVEVIYDQGNGIKEMNPMPARYLRRDADDKALWWYATSWKQATRLKERRGELYRHGTERAKAAGKGIAIIKMPQPGFAVYGKPRWVSCIPDAELVAAIAEFNRIQVDYGFASGAHIHLPTGKTGKDLQRLERRVIEKFTGPRGQPLIVTAAMPGEAKPEITALPLMNNAGKQEELREAATRQVFRACGIPGVLADVEVATGFDGKSVATREAVERWQRLTIEPYQQTLEKLYTKLLRDILNVGEGKDSARAMLLTSNPIAFFGESRERERYMTRNDYRVEAGLRPVDQKGWGDRPARDPLPEQPDGLGVAPATSQENEP